MNRAGRIRQVLLQNSQIVDLLAENIDDNGFSKEASILPVFSATQELNTPFITTQDGVGSPEGQQLKSETFYLRVYDDKTRSTYTINELCDLIILTLDNVQLNIDRHTFVTIRYNGLLPTTTDDIADKNFREVHFTMHYL